MNQDVALPELRDDVLAVGRFFTDHGEVHIIEAYTAPGAAAPGLHAGASGKDDHHITAKGAGNFCLSDAKTLAGRNHQHNRDDPPRDTKHGEKCAQLVRPEGMECVDDEVVK